MKKIFLTVAVSLSAVFAGAANSGGKYLSPTAVAIQPGTGNAYVLLSTVPALAVLDTGTEQLLSTVPLGFTPGSFTFSADGRTLYVTEYSAEGKLHIMSVPDHKVRKSVAVGAYPAAVVVDRDGARAWVANRFSNDVSAVDLEKRRETARIPMVREPKSLALSPDGRMLAVGNLLPGGTALDPVVSAQVTLVDTGTSEVIRHVSLSDGSQSIEDVCFSGDGSKVFATHLLSRYQFPTTHLDRGWMNTNALSVVDAGSKTHYVTVLLDDMYRGAANPCGMSLSEDGRTLLVAVSGTHELITLDLPSMLAKIEGSKDRNTLANDLLFLNDVKQRIPLPGKGPRRVAAKGGKIFVSSYFSGGLSVVEPGSYPQSRFVNLGDEPEMDDVRKGELYFADADLCFQNWQSCISCHPEGRADGLNWDLLNDGMGNPKNSKSLLYAHMTPPCMITGIRADAETAVRAGIHHIQFADRPEEDAACIDAYLMAMRPLPSPYLVKGKLSKEARKGKVVYEKAGCRSCHHGEYYTDGKKYNAGTGIGEYQDYAFDTPTLREIWRTAPYLYNGSARTIKDVLTLFNKDDRHGATSSLTGDEIDALEQYILSL